MCLLFFTIVVYMSLRVSDNHVVCLDTQSYIYHFINLSRHLSDIHVVCLDIHSYIFYFLFLSGHLSLLPVLYPVSVTYV
jgi:hypothetical protein